MKTAALLCLAILTGCATTKRHSAPAEYFTDSNGKNHVVSGEIIKTVNDSGVYVSWSHALNVSIDGLTAISGNLDPHNFNGTLRGSYQNQPAIAVCTSKSIAPNYYNINCDITLEGNKIASLRF